MLLMLSSIIIVIIILTKRDKYLSCLSLSFLAKSSLNY